MERTQHHSQRPLNGGGAFFGAFVFRTEFNVLASSITSSPPSSASSIFRLGSARPRGILGSSLVVGGRVGEKVGDGLGRSVGLRVTCDVGTKVGLFVVGIRVCGSPVGANVGVRLGRLVGIKVGTRVVGTEVGSTEVGLSVGVEVGISVGVGELLGDAVLPGIGTEKELPLSAATAVEELPKTRT